MAKKIECKILVICAAMVAAAFVCTVANAADTRLSGDVIYRDEGVEVAPPMPASEARKYFRYRRESARSEISIEQSPPREISWAGFRDSDQGVHRYLVQFKEDDEEIVIQVEFSSRNFSGTRRDVFPRFGSPVLHLFVDRVTNYRDALEKADAIIENESNPAEILRGFNVLSIELMNEPPFAYRGMKVLSDLIGLYALHGPANSLPPQVALYLDRMSEVSPLRSFSARRQFEIYSLTGSTLIDHYDLLQPIGGGRAVHDIASKLLNEGIQIAYASVDDPGLQRRVVANTVLRKAKMECEEVSRPRRCAETVASYLSAYPTYTSRDVHSFLSTLGTALEVESRIPTFPDGTKEARISRVQSDSYLKGLWALYFCASSPVIQLIEKADDLSSEMKSYLTSLHEFSGSVAQGRCDHETT